ncbi:MAG: di-trans,poly-cis-decaprenylcistransferase [Spirochaetaceae bacterium]|nr:MAG: di-trans,poly-cis-decaprenylcistransferase [Spirochaetaceae bacterium]
MSAETTPSDPTLPRHVGIIMDGNGRWATERNLRRTRGHQEGVEAAKRVVIELEKLGVEFLSLYAFSTENWRRTEEEVSFLMALVARNLRDHYDFYRENRIRLHHSGDLAGLPPDVRAEIAAVTRDTEGYSGIQVNLAVNYGGRNEIIRAFKRWGDRGDADLTEQTLASFLDLPQFPDPDLIIRTGGEQRISNFLLWQSAYSEWIFSPKLWPDWCDEDVRAAIAEYQHRVRNFGGDR